MPSIVSRPIAAAADIPPEWIDVVRETIQRDGVAVRGGASHTIEVWSFRAEKFIALQLPNHGVSFETADARDLILQRLVGPAPRKNEN